MPNDSRADDLPQSMIRFNCGFCGQSIRVPRQYAGKKGKCPKCKSIIVIIQDDNSVESPPAKSDTAKPDPITDIFLQPPPKSETVEAPQPVFTKQQQFDDLRLSAGLTALTPEPPPQRKYPWLIDVFLYPANREGMIFLGIVALLPILLQLFIMLLILTVGVLAIVVIVINLLINVVLGMFLYWFVAECIRDSAFGNLRVPETIAETPGFGEMALRLVRMFGCFAVCAAPAFFYHRYTQGIDLPFWLLLSAGVFLYPMTLLGVIMFDSIYGVNPLVIIPSIFSTFFQYCGLVVFIGLILFLFFLTRGISIISPLLYLFARIPQIYLVLVAAHLLGRFYFRYKEKLNWEV